MCGIAGAIGPRDGGVLVGQMLDAVRHRGPDGTGFHTCGARHIGAARLAIIDPSAGDQPLYDEAQRICVVFNGEIYNHRELRVELERKGHVFRTRCDTEVIVHLYEEESDACLQRIDGMFALAVLDGPRLLLARDRLGIKPLYYAAPPDGQLFLFASEIKALLRHRGLAPRLDVQTLADTIALGHPIGDQTFFEGIRTLQPGNTLVVTNHGGLRVGTPTAYAARRPERAADVGLEQAMVSLGATLDRSVERHLAADVEVGLTLSGGLDSTVLALLAREHVAGSMPTFAVGDHPEQVDVVQAESVARLVGSDHHRVLVGFNDFLDTIPSLIAAEEQPSSLYGVPFHVLCRRITQRCPAVLHGEGADELFGGYAAYTDRAGRLAPIRERLPRLKALGVAPSDRAVEVIKALAAPVSDAEYVRALFDWNMAEPLERQHLVPVDACGMASGVEVRVPYLDQALVELVGTLPLVMLVRFDLGIRKYLLRRFALGRWGTDVFDAVMREKVGAPSAGSRHLSRFAQWCRQRVPDEYVERHEFGRCFGSRRELLLFDLFLEIFMVQRGDAAGVDIVEFVRSRATSGARRQAHRPSAEAVQDGQAVGS